MKTSIVSTRLATLLRNFRGHLRLSAMVCDAPQGLKSQENALFYRSVWPGLMTYETFKNVIKKNVNTEYVQEEMLKLTAGLFV